MKKITTNDVMYALISVVVFFTTTDIVATICDNITIATISSVVSSLAVFIGSYRIRVKELDNTVAGSVEFIKSNFSKSSVILSILDLVCTIIMLVTSFISVCLLFRLPIAIKTVALMTKFQSISRILLVGSIIYIAKRRIFMSELKMTKTQWISMGVFVAGIAYGILSYFFPVLAIFGDTTLNALSACGISTVAGLVGIFQNGKQKTEEELKKDEQKLAELTTNRLHKMALTEAKQEIKANLKEEKANQKAIEKQNLEMLVKQKEKAMLDKQQELQKELELKANTNTINNK